MAGTDDPKPRGVRGLEFGQATLLALAYVLINLPFQARTPQSQDGAEMIAAALHGGVLHPPGFPLQAWIDRAIVHFPFSIPARNLSLLSLLAGAGCGFFLFRTVREATQSLLSSLFAVCCLFFFPAFWTLSNQPEKYTLALCFVAAIVWESSRISQLSRVGWWRWVILGLLCGLGLGEHLGVAAAIPAPVAAWGFGRMELKQRVRSAATFSAVASIAAAGCCLSMLWLTRPGSWPDWGKLSSVQDVVRHVSRGDLPHFFGGLHQNGKAPHNGLAYFFRDYFSCFGVIGLLVFVGARGFYRARRHVLLFAAAGGLAVASAWLWGANLGTDELLAHASFERYGIFAMYFCALLMGAGLNALVASLGEKWRTGMMLVSVCLCAFFFIGGRQAGNFSNDNTIEVYRAILARTLPVRAFYVGNSDLESLSGLETSAGLRFPLAGDYPWYLRQVVPILEPRLEFNGTAALPTGIFSIVDKAFDAGYPVYSTATDYLVAPGRVLQRRGLFWAIEKGVSASEGSQSAEAAVTACGPLEQLKFPRPEQGHYFSRFVWQEFPGAFVAASSYYSSRGDLKRKKLSDDIANSLIEGSTPEIWITACEGLRRSL